MARKVVLFAASVSVQRASIRLCLSSLQPSASLCASPRCQLTSSLLDGSPTPRCLQHRLPPGPRPLTRNASSFKDFLPVATAPSAECPPPLCAGDLPTSPTIPYLWCFTSLALCLRRLLSAISTL